MTLTMTTPTIPVGRRCSRCGTCYAPHLIAAAFTVKRGGLGLMHQPQLDTTCRPCQQTARDQRKLADRWQVKARDTIRRHAIRLEVDKRDLVQVYGWDPKLLAHEAEHHYGNGCSYCAKRYVAMGHGLSDITLDIVDSSRMPYYRTNTKWCCQTCNRIKGDRGPEFFEQNRQVYETWTAAQNLSAEQRGWLF